MTFAEHLFQLRTEKQFKQQEIADAVGISLRAYQYYERGYREPQLSTLVALARFLGEPLDRLVCSQETQCTVHADIIPRTFLPVNQKKQEMTFGEHLFQLRTERQLKQQDLADVVGLSLRAYQYYERGYREPQLTTLLALADFYDLPLDELVCRRRKKP